MQCATFSAKKVLSRRLETHPGKCATGGRGGWDDWGTRDYNYFFL